MIAFAFPEQVALCAGPSQELHIESHGRAK